ETTLRRPTVPDEYPNVLALPVTGRPLFPGFYKAVVIRNKAVQAAVKELMQRGQPYIGAFLLREDEADVDVVTDINQIHRVGVFAQITSLMPPEEDDDAMTMIIYPHRRIRITDLSTPHQSLDKAAKQEPAAAAEDTSNNSDDGDDGAGGEIIVHGTRGGGTAASAKKQPIHPFSPDILLRDYDVTVANVVNIHDEPVNRHNPVVRAITSEIVAVFKDIATLNPLFRDQIASFSMSQSAANIFEEPGRLADFAAAVSAGEPEELQSILESPVIEARMEKALTVLKKELLNAQLQSKISKEVEQKIQKRQREYYLMEQLKGIKRELGLESDGKDKLLEGFRERASKLTMPEAVSKVFDEEMAKLAQLEPVSSEFNVTRNYLDWITQVPWGRRNPENFSIPHAMRVLDEDHYGLKDVKDRILEFIAVSKLRGTVQGKILCLVGPPGVGKTSIGKSVARALSREFYRFSVGGLTDVAEIKGHRRTYVGAMPGKAVQALKKVQTENPLILIDEVDKIGRGHQGDPASALLEMLDPEQNDAFMDHYMDVPIDLSRVLFVCTANVLDTIPGPLLDRMEVIQLSGYIAEEKAAIASKYLAPLARETTGLGNVDVELTPDAIDTLIRSYCRESGVRNLKKHIEKIYRKAALQIVKEHGVELPAAEEQQQQEGATSSAEAKSEAAADKSATAAAITPPQPMIVPSTVHQRITSDNVKDYVGPPLFTSDRLYERTPPGVVMGLAWTNMGGSALYIESVLETALTSPDNKPGLAKTGQMGEVMRESGVIAYTFIKNLMIRRFPENNFFERASIH
ncbi:P-loop containing nucleoside triphosphate hydrolase protein, partial [Syncephalis pseudoplumigaleata]